MRHWIRILTFLLLGSTAVPSTAHEFTLFYLVPPEIEPHEIEDIWAGFFLASSERDSHAGETAHGHLGGIDVYLTVLDAGPDDMIIALQPDIVGVPVSWAGEDVAIGRFVDVAVAYAPSAEKAEHYLGTAETPSISGTFDERFLETTGREPTVWARASYALARLVSEAIRPLDAVRPVSVLQSRLDNLR